jgi:hypothetical protein
MGLGKEIFIVYSAAGAAGERQKVMKRKTTADKPSEIRLKLMSCSFLRLGLCEKACSSYEVNVM